jgi:hypothetical protein
MSEAVGTIDFNSLCSEVSKNLNTDEKITAAIKYNITQSFKKNLYYNIVWHFFHSFSVFYTASGIEWKDKKADLYSFMNNIKKTVVGCSSCLTDDSHFLINNMDEVISSNQTMVEWFVQLHNTVNMKKNEKLGTDIRTDWTAQEVIDKYKQTDYVSFLNEKYKIDMDSLLKNNKLSTFYDELAIVRNTINSDNTEYVTFNLETFLNKKLKI